MRGTFGNIRLRNALAERRGRTRVHQPSGEEMFIYDAAMRYRDEGVPLIVIAGREYGSGSSRDWAAKGTALLGVRAVLAESYERIHRSNLVGMGVLPLQFLPGESAASLGLTGRERYTIAGLEAGLAAAAAGDGRGRPTTSRAGSGASARSPASTARSRSATTATAASCRPCCGGSRRPDRALPPSQGSTVGRRMGWPIGHPSIPAVHSEFQRDPPGPLRIFVDSRLRRRHTLP